MVFSGTDHAYLTEVSVPIVREFTDIYEGISDRRELWTSGEVSPLFLEAVEEQGWAVHTGARAEILPRIPWGLDPLPASASK